MSANGSGARRGEPRARRCAAGHQPCRSRPIFEWRSSSARRMPGAAKAELCVGAVVRSGSRRRNIPVYRASATGRGSLTAAHRALKRGEVVVVYPRPLHSRPEVAERAKNGSQNALSPGAVSGGERATQDGCRRDERPRLGPRRRVTSRRAAVDRNGGWVARAPARLDGSPGDRRRHRAGRRHRGSSPRGPTNPGHRRPHLRPAAVAALTTSKSAVWAQRRVRVRYAPFLWGGTPGRPPRPSRSARSASVVGSAVYGRPDHTADQGGSSPFGRGATRAWAMLSRCRCRSCSPGRPACSRSPRRAAAACPRPPCTAGCATGTGSACSRGCSWSAGTGWATRPGVRAAWLWAGGEPAAVTGPAAAYWHGMLERAPAVVDLTVPRGTHRRPQPGTRLRRRDVAV